MRVLQIALLSAIGSGAVTQAMAQATQVNIADPNTSTRAAKVEPGNRLAVQEVPPASFSHQGAIGILGQSCEQIGVTPSGKALIIHQVRVHGQPGTTVLFYAHPASLPGAIVGEGTVPQGS